MQKRSNTELGATFGRLTVIEYAELYRSPKGQVHRKVVCRCECGNQVTVRLGALNSGTTTSCGCRHLEGLIARSTTHGQAAGNKTPNYNLWQGIKARAVSTSGVAAKNYSKRGITMYSSWIHDFQAFDSWVSTNLGPRPNGCSLDRVDNNGNYEPGNLRWATAEEQTNNTRRNNILTWRGESMTLARWAAKQGLLWHTLWMRVYALNWELEKALTTPIKKPKPREV